MGTLNVFSGNDKIFTKSGNQGNDWIKVTRTVYFSDIVSTMYIVSIQEVNNKIWLTQKQTNKKVGTHHLLIHTRYQNHSS